MKTKVTRIASLTTALRSLLRGRQVSLRQEISSLVDSIRTLQGETADRRFQQITGRLKMLGDDLDMLMELACGDFLVSLERSLDELGASMTQARLGSVLARLLDGLPLSLNPFCELLLDCMIEVTGAERAFVMFCVPESMEADVISARNFETKNLSQQEYSFSRTLVRQVLKDSQPVLIDNALEDPAYSAETTVKQYEVRSVLAIPLKHNDLTIGALYLEDNRATGAFSQDDIDLLTSVSRFSTWHLSSRRLLPTTFGRLHGSFLDAGAVLAGIVGQSGQICDLRREIGRLADAPAAVVIEGETGTGKELVAKALHYESCRRDGPFVAFNAAAITESLAESELFGHEKGAFTGAIGARRGLIEQANCGTLFIDEMNKMPSWLQGKLLRCLEEKTIRRVGGAKDIPVEVRIVAATSSSLTDMARQGKLDEALFFRFDAIKIRVPPLRERAADIPLLVDHFRRHFSVQYRKAITVEPDTYECMKEYRFPGNIRELRNIVEELFARSDDGTSIRIGDLPKKLTGTEMTKVGLFKDPLYRALHSPVQNLNEWRDRRSKIATALSEQRRQLFQRVIEESGGNLTEAAVKLGINRVTLHKLLRPARSDPKDSQ